MFDDVLGLAEQGTNEFRSNVNDSFGNSIIGDVLDPIIDEIRSLHSFHGEFKHQILIVDQLLQEARSIQLKAGF